MLDEMVLCQCGDVKVNGNNSGVYVCMNCDAVQRIELTEISPGVYGKRVMTPQDIAYNKATKKLIEENYGK